jgi:hypothetical protein
VVGPQNRPVPEGRKRTKRFSKNSTVPSGLIDSFPLPPSVKTLGYFRTSLRDSDPVGHAHAGARFRRAGGKSGGPARRREAVECANLIYAGTKSSVCFSEQFLSAVASETSINAARKFKPVKLADKEIFRFPSPS